MNPLHGYEVPSTPVGIALFLTAIVGLLASPVIAYYPVVVSYL